MMFFCSLLTTYIALFFSLQNALHASFYLLKTHAVKHIFALEQRSKELKYLLRRTLETSQQPYEALKQKTIIFPYNLTPHEVTCWKNDLKKERIRPQIKDASFYQLVLEGLTYQHTHYYPIFFMDRQHIDQTDFKDIINIQSSLIFDINFGAMGYLKSIIPRFKTKEGYLWQHYSAFDLANWHNSEHQQLNFDALLNNEVKALVLEVYTPVNYDKSEHKRLGHLVLCNKTFYQDPTPAHFYDLFELAHGPEKYHPNWIQIIQYLLSNLKEIEEPYLNERVRIFTLESLKKQLKKKPY
jgi:hypothetical protein